MMVRAFGRRWGAGELIALTCVIAASCALPGYELESASGSGTSSAGGGAATTSTSSSGGFDTTASSSSGSGGSKDPGAGGGGGPDVGACPPPTQEPDPGAACGLPDNTACAIERPCCDVKIKCISGKWETPPPGCPGGCPSYPPKPTCDCNAAQLAHACFYNTGCDVGNPIKMLTCANGSMTFEPFDCCSPNNSCLDGAKKCVHLPDPSGPGVYVNVCVPNPCGDVVDCACADAKGMCVLDGLVCKQTDPLNGIKCGP